MKRIYCFTMALGMMAILFTTDVIAQTKDADPLKIYNTWQSQLKEKYKKMGDAGQELPKATQEQLEKEIAAHVAGEIALVQQKLKTYNAEQAKSRTVPYVPTKGKKGEFDFVPLFNVPAPASDLATAFSIGGLKDKTSVYDHHQQLLEKKGKEIAALEVRNNKINNIYQKEGQAGLEKNYRKEADKNVMMQQMGGLEKVEKMSEEERKTAALKAASNMLDNPVMAMGGTGNAGMDKLMQEMMQNPELAKKFEKMNDAEKQAFMKKYVQNTPRNDAQHEKMMKEKNENEYAMKVMQIIQRMNEGMMAASKIYVERMNIFEKEKERSLNKLGKWALSKCDALPIINGGMGVGRTKDMDEMAAIQKVIETAQHKWAEAALLYHRVQWESYRVDALASIQEFNEFYGNYEYGKQMKDVNAFSGAYIEPQISEAAVGVLELINQITKQAKDMTSQAMNDHDTWMKSKTMKNLFFCEGS